MASKKIQKFDPAKDLLEYEFNYNSVETKNLQTKMKENDQVCIADLRQISLWKLNRVLNVSDNTIEKLQNLAKNPKIAIDDRICKDAIDSLVSSEGIWYPMASAILKFIRPDVFPIIDVRAYRALTGKKIYRSMYTYEKYVEYTKNLTDIAKKRNRPLCEIDEQLYCYDEMKNGHL